MSRRRTLRVVKKDALNIIIKRRPSFAEWGEVLGADPAEAYLRKRHYRDLLGILLGVDFDDPRCPPHPGTDAPYFTAEAAAFWGHTKKRRDPPLAVRLNLGITFEGADEIDLQVDLAESWLSDVMLTCEGAYYEEELDECEADIARIEKACAKSMKQLRSVVEIRRKAMRADPEARRPGSAEAVGGVA